VTCAEAVTIADLRGLRALVRPHLAVREVVEVSLMLLGYRDAKWSAALGLFGRPEDFLAKMRAFDASRNVSRLQFQKLCRCLSGPQKPLDEGHTEKLSAAAGGLVNWCRAVYNVLAIRFGADVPQLASSGGGGGAQQRDVGARSPEATAPSTTERSGSLSSALSPRGADANTLGQQGGSPATSGAVFGSRDVSNGSSSILRGDLPTGTDDVTEAPRSRPDLGDLQIFPDIYSMSTTELRRVRNLTIRREGVGEVTFQCEIDLIREQRVLADLPSIIRLDPGEVVLYPDAGTKPPEGDGLNRPATITLFQCMPPNSGVFPDADSKARYRERIAKMTEQKGARFVDYDCDRGIWQFRVDHF